MDPTLAVRLDENSPAYDDELYRKLAKVAQDYRTAGTATLDYHIPDLDEANDIVNCYTAGRKKDFEKDRNAPARFRHPMGATEITTLATFVSQILFGGETTRRVEPRNPEDEDKADIINELLAWNDGQQPTYPQGYHWVWDSLTFNRGVMYDRWAKLLEVHLEPVEQELPYVAELDERGKKKRKPKNWKGESYIRFRKVRVPIGGYVRVDNISPYDFICDPGMPPMRFQEGRFAGHRVMLAWSELERRSKLDPSDYEYVLPSVVEKLKKGKSRTRSAVGTRGNNSTNDISSRSAYERSRRGAPVLTTTGSDKITQEEGGLIECWCIIIRETPKTYDIFDDEEQELIELLLAGEGDLLSCNILTNKHDQYPYSVGEGRGNAHQQFGPSWAHIIKGPQDFLDYMKDRRRESLARTSGNIFIGNPDYIDFEAFADPEKDGLFIPVKEKGAGKPIEQIIKQVPVTDTTARFADDMAYWQQSAEQASGAHAATQGVTEDPSQSATQFVGTQQMAQGRISTIARLLSAGGLMQQTQRIVSNLQQFLPDTMIIRITGEHDEFNPDKPQEKFLTVVRDKTDPDFQEAIAADPELAAKVLNIPDIQGTFDVVVSDGSLPGADAKKVAALSRAIEAFSGNPAFAEVFDRARPGAIDPIKTFQKLLRATGFPTGGLLVSKTDAQKNLMERSVAAGAGVPMPSPNLPPEAMAMNGAPVPTMETGAGPIPSAEALPPIPSAAPPVPSPQTV